MSTTFINRSMQNEYPYQNFTEELKFGKTRVTENAVISRLKGSGVNLPFESPKGLI